MRADQRREGRHGPALGTAEDGAERRGLPVVRALVDIGGERPIAVRHGARRMRGHGDVEAVQRHLAVAALIDVEDQRHVAGALARPRGQRRAGRDEAGADHVAVAVLEIVAGQSPFGLAWHGRLPAGGIGQPAKPMPALAPAASHGSVKTAALQPPISRRRTREESWSISVTVSSSRMMIKLTSSQLRTLMRSAICKPMPAGADHAEDGGADGCCSRRIQRLRQHHRQHLRQQPEAARQQSRAARRASSPRPGAARRSRSPRHTVLPARTPPPPRSPARRRAARARPRARRPAPRPADPCRETRRTPGAGEVCTTRSPPRCARRESPAAARSPPRRRCRGTPSRRSARALAGCPPIACRELGGTIWRQDDEQPPTSRAPDGRG